MVTKSQIFEPIVNEVIPKRTLLVLSKGMASPLLIAQLIAGYYDLKKQPLILLLNFKKETIPTINNEIKENKFGNFQIHQITNETTVKRSSMYLSSGVFSVSNVILTMDLLQKAITPSVINAIIINKAERIESIQDEESWITTMIRRENRNIAHCGLCIDKKSSFIYFKRSRYEILKDVTDSSDFETFESVIGLPGPLKKVQKALMNLIKICIEELNSRYKERNKGDPVLTENDIFNTSLRLLNQKFRAIMNKVNVRYNRLFRDVFDFRALLQDLVYLDSIEFYARVIHTKNKAGLESIWYIGDTKTMESIEELLKLSKARVFRFKKEYLLEDVKEEGLEFENKDPNKSNRTSNSSTATNGIDEASNFSLVSERVEEKNEYKSPWIKNPISFEDDTYTFNVRTDINFKYKALIEIIKNISKKTANPIPVWIICSDKKVVHKIQKVINSYFSKKDENLIDQLFKLKELLDLLKPPVQQQSQSLENNEKVQGFPNSFQRDKEKEKPKPVQKSNSLKRSDTSKDIKVVEDSILEKFAVDLAKFKRDYEKKMLINAIGYEGANEEDLHNALEGLEERHKIQNPILFVEELDDLQDTQNSLKRKFGHLEKSPSLEVDFIPPESKKVLTKDDIKSTRFDIIDIEKINTSNFQALDDFGEIIFDSKQVEGLDITVNCLSTSTERAEFISKTKPQILILFEPQISIIREVMLLKRCAKYDGSVCPISQIHTLMVQNSLESAIYLDTIKREHDAFVSILRERQNLAQLDDDPESRIKKIMPKKSENTRAGKGSAFLATISLKPMIIIDKREFNAPLTARLYHDGFWIVPVLLEKGDYILSNNIAVERKSVETGDLLNSIRSGRLENQLANMCKAFARPILLIEFSEAIDFSLEPAEVSKFQQNVSWLNDMNTDNKDSNRSNVKFYLSLLSMKFPKVAIMWSKSPEFTSKLFRSLKENNPEPDIKNFIKFQEEVETKTDSDPVASQLREEDEKQDLSKFLS